MNPLMLYLIAMLCMGATTQTPEERELATQFPAEIVDAAVLSAFDAAAAEGALSDLFSKLRMRPRYALAVFAVPGEKKARLVCIRGKEADVALVKKLLVAMEQAAAAGASGAGAPFVMRVETREVAAGEMLRRIAASARRAGLPVSEKDFFIYPEGAGGTLFFVGAEELGPRMTEMAKGLDKAAPPRPTDVARAYLRQVSEEALKAFGALISTVVSALSLLLLHGILCRLPFLGKRYRRSFRLFWEKLFASFKGQDLAWEIIKAGAGLGVASAAPLRGAGDRARPAVPAQAGLSQEERKRALEVASAYLDWRGLDPETPRVRRILEAAVDAEAARGA